MGTILKSILTIFPSVSELNLDTCDPNLPVLVDRRKIEEKRIHIDFL